MKKNLKYIAFFLLLLSQVKTMAQMHPPLPDACGTAPGIAPVTLPSISLCPGVTYAVPTITVGGAPFTVQNYYWTPASVATTTSGGSGAPMTFSGTATGTLFTTSYTFTAITYGPQLINNGGFHMEPSAGTYDGFNTQYQNYSGPTGNHHGHIKLGGFGGEYISGQTCMDPRGTSDWHYDVLSHGATACAWAGCSNMLCVRGAEPGYGRQYTTWSGAWRDDKKALKGPGYFWGQNVQLCKGEQYHMSYWVRMMDKCNTTTELPSIGMAVTSSWASCPVTTAENDSWSFSPNYQDVFNVPFPLFSCDTSWHRRDINFTSPVTGSVFICLIDLNTSGSGNAFGIDDISLNRVRVVSTLPFTITPPNPVPTIATPAPTCVGVASSFTINGTNGNIINYTITTGSTTLLTGSGTIAGGSLTTIPVTPAACGSLKITITSITEPSCPRPFIPAPPIVATMPVYAKATIGGPYIMCGLGSIITIPHTGGCTGPLGTSWSSSNHGVATVSATGVVTAAGAGVTTITYNNGSPCACSTTVKVYAPSEFFTADGGTGGSPNWCMFDHKNFYIHGNSGDVVTYHITNSSGSMPAVTATIPGSGTGIIPVPYTCPVMGTATITITNILTGGPCTFTRPIAKSITVDLTPTPGSISPPFPPCGGYIWPLSFTGLPHTGGLWTSSNPAMGTINSATGMLTTNDITPYPSFVNSTITYSFTNHCGHTFASMTETLNATPSVSLTYAGGCLEPGTGIPTYPRPTYIVCPGIAPTVTIHAPVGTVVAYYLYSAIYGPSGHSPAISITMTAPTYNVTVPAPGTVWPFWSAIGIDVVYNPITGCSRWPVGETIMFKEQSPNAHFDATGPLDMYSYYTPITSHCVGTSFKIRIYGLPGATVMVDNGHGLLTPVVINMGTFGYFTDVFHTASYTYCIRSVTGPGGCCSVTAPDPAITNPCFTVSSWPVPVVTLANSTPPPCGATTFPITLVSGGSPVSTYTWVGTGFYSVTTPGSVHSEYIASSHGGTFIVTGAEPVHGCVTTATVVVTPRPFPAFISGPATVCLGGTITLNDATAYGTWSSSNPAIVSVVSTSGLGMAAVVRGMGLGTANIIYTLPTGCSTIFKVSVTAIEPITGAGVACGPGFTTTLAHSGSGTWSSNNTGIATVTVATGIVTGVSPGTTTVTFTTTAGCYTTTTVNILPGGPVVICSYHSVVVGGIGYWAISGTPGATITLSYLFSGSGCPAAPFPVVLDATGTGLVAYCTGAYGLTFVSGTYEGCLSIFSCSMTSRHADNTIPATTEEKETALVVIPNPNTGSFTVSGTIANQPGLKEARIEIIDILGKTIVSDRTTIENGEIHKNITLGSSIANGIYLARITTGSDNQVIRFTVNR